MDVVGIGFTSGEISVYDIRADERLMRMFMEGGAIRGLSFRSGKYSASADFRFPHASLRKMDTKFLLLCLLTGI